MERIEDRSESKTAGWFLDHRGRETTPGPERSDAARNRGKILEAAWRLFSERGVTGVTMEEIAGHAGVGKGTLYRKFPHKGLLCQALLEEPTRRLQGETLELIGRSEWGWLQKLDAFLDRVVWFTEENLDLLYGGHEPLCGEERLAHLSHPAHDWLRWTVLGLLRGALGEGELGEDLDVEYLAAALLAPLGIDLYYHHRKVVGFSPERISAGLRSLVPGKLQ